MCVGFSSRDKWRTDKTPAELLDVRKVAAARQHQHAGKRGGECAVEAGLRRGCGRGIWRRCGPGAALPGRSEPRRGETCVGHSLGSCPGFPVSRLRPRSVCWVDCGNTRAAPRAARAHGWLPGRGSWSVSVGVDVRVGLPLPEKAHFSLLRRKRGDFVLVFVQPPEVAVWTAGEQGCEWPSWNC